MPTLNGGRIHQVHAHVFGLLGVVKQTRFVALELSGHSEQADNHLCGVLDLGVPNRFVFKEVGGEEHFQHRLDGVVRLPVGLLHGFNGRLISGRSQPPSRNLGLVSYEVVVKVTGKEASGSRLLAGDLNDVVSVPVAGLAQESLFLGVVVGGVEPEFPRAATMRERRVRRSDVPTSESPGACFDVVFTVVEAFVHSHA